MTTAFFTRLAAGATALAITGAFATTLAAQNDERIVATSCGAGVIELCGETETHICGWKWKWLPISMFPIIGMYPTYECKFEERVSLYKNKGTPDNGSEFGPIAHEM